MSELIRPGAHVENVTKSDTVDIVKWNNAWPRSLYIGGAGDVVVVCPDGSFATFASAVAGSVLPVQAKRVNSTNTTATNIVALY